jgi:hypothetical protein
MNQDDFDALLHAMWGDTFGRSSFREDRLTPVEFMLFRYYMMDSGGRPSDFFRYAHERAKLYFQDQCDFPDYYNEMFNVSISGPDTAGDDEDYEEYEAAQQERFERENKRLEALGLCMSDHRSPMEQWGITEPDQLTEEQRLEQERWWKDHGRWLEDL